MAAEPTERVHALVDSGYWVIDAVIDIDAQVARQLVVESVVEIVDPEDPGFEEPIYLDGPAGLWTSW
jgi:hypothetical protein